MDINYVLMRFAGLCLVVLAVFVVFFGCSSAPEREEEPEEKPAVEGKGEEVTGTADQTPPGQPQVEEPRPEEPSAENEESQAEKFEASEELYKETFQDIEALIRELNQIIQEGKYKVWLTYLTDEYIRKTSRHEYLRRWQKDPRLAERNITLHTLKDYFEYVVVPTRSRVKLDEIDFVDDDHVYAYTVFEGQKYLLYNLIKTDDGWKIDFY